jgi:hypothetical protein
VNKRKLQDFASWAKINLEKQIELSLKKIGINSEKDIRRSRVQGDITIIDGIESTYKKGFHAQREEIINKIKSDGYDHSVEQFASTWFNRIIALRFMEVHDYFDHGFKLFPSEPNTIPDILTKLSLVSDYLNLDMSYCNQLQTSGNNNEELYRYVLFQQCNALAKALPMLFSSGLSYLEYFIPTPLLFGDTLVNRLIEIDEADFEEDVEIIGWLYQFYVSFLREETRKKKKIGKNDIPILSQVFTTSWIVKYMAENSLGRLWLESYPNSNLKTTMKYYVEEAEQSEDIIEKLNQIKYRNIDVEELKVIEPCSGSGHILTNLFDLFFQMYLEKGYSRKDIPRLIIKNNLYGLDIDQRATQLASFALAMKARSIDNKFFDSDRYVRPKVYEIIDSKAILYSKYNGKSYLDLLKDYNDNQWKGENQLSDEELKAIKYVVEHFVDAKVVGSLLKVRPYKYLAIRKKLAENLRKNTQADIFTSGFFDYEYKSLMEILRTSFILSSKYDLVITNPPYIGISNIDNNPKDYLKSNYPNSNADMFSMFMEVPYLKDNGLIALVNPDSWMFLKSFEKLRSNLINSSHFISMTHHGMGEFDAVVQTTAFVLRNSKLPEYNGVYYRLVDSKNKKSDFVSKKESLRFISKNTIFRNIPGQPIVYWITPIMLEVFKSKTPIGDFYSFREGIHTADNNRFLRLWHEISHNKIVFNAKTQFDVEKQGKWVPYNKGGKYKKWYGNNEYVIGYDNASIREMSKLKGFVQPSKDLYFKEGGTWTAVSSGKFSVRYYPEGFLFDAGGQVVIGQDIYLVISMLNSVLFDKISKIMMPTLNYKCGLIKTLPDLRLNSSYIREVTKENISLVKKDWNLFETSWDFVKHPLINRGNLKTIFSNYTLIRKSDFEKLKQNEEELNDTFIKSYGLQDELSKNVEDGYVSISLADKIRDVKSLISYLIGVLMGRYSLAEEGLIYAGGDFDHSRYGNYDVDQDGIIPIFPDLSFENGLVHRIIKLIKNVYGDEHYRENIEFIANALGKKSNETNEETLNRYLNQEFYSDHLKIYQKRPIYWMFSSGKKNGFKALIYMHRYNSNTLAKMNASYFQPATTLLRTRISEIEKQIFAANDKEKVQIERLRFSLVEQLNEAIEYGQVLDYMANKYISIDLDDGVNNNYDKFQEIEISTSNGKVKKDLLVPIK